MPVTCVQQLRALWVKLREEMSAVDELEMAVTRMRLRLPGEATPGQWDVHVLEKPEVLHPSRFSSCLDFCLPACLSVCLFVHPPICPSPSLPPISVSSFSHIGCPIWNSLHLDLRHEPTCISEVKTENPSLLLCILICRFTNPSPVIHVFVVCVCVRASWCARACVCV